ncbi:hypothetical protein [Deinococcus marmoris]|uniref:Uncharacterized protein n=1 Tax=Deinococcus marmoris TaxID=249408 RepID=A0A1U7NS85_9DEIO|nr:hypothetical protein [Deinococcus marmoris]OLV15783.1 hypothetical protein BOO71_0013969 [Deinococcus marmoris]
MSYNKVQIFVPRSFASLSLAALTLSASLSIPASAQRALPASAQRTAPLTAPLETQVLNALPDLPESPVSDTPDSVQKLAPPSAADAELARGCEGNLLGNGDISAFTMNGSTNFPPSSVPGWNRVVNTPQVSPTPGYGGTNGWLVAWGYKDGGESFAQNVSLAPGSYKLTLATRQHSGATNPTPTQYRVAFRSGVTANPWGVPGTVTLDSAPMTNAGWATQTYTFNLTSATNVMQVNTFNDKPTSAVTGHPKLTSWTAYDSFCLQRVKKGQRRGLTWTVNEVQNGLVRVGQHATSDPYLGDTPETQTLPMLCIFNANLPLPPGLVPDFYHGWSKSVVQLTTPILGSLMTSQAAADAICAGQFGAGWKMGEFHDGGGGWSFWAMGPMCDTLKGTKFWTAINDQPANVWNSVP